MLSLWYVTSYAIHHAFHAKEILGKNLEYSLMAYHLIVQSFELATVFRAQPQVDVITCFRKPSRPVCVVMFPACKKIYQVQTY